MMIHNPAGRLHAILRTAKDDKAIRTTNTEKALLKILNTPDENKSLLIKRLGIFLGLPSEIESQITKIPDLTHDLYLKWMPAFYVAFSNISFNQQFTAIIDKIGEDTIYGIEICAEELRRKFPEKNLRNEDLDKLKGEIGSLIDKIANSEINSFLKKFLIEKLDAAYLAIQEYFLTGAKSIERSVEMFLGGCRLNGAELEKHKEDPLFQECFEKISKIVLMLNLAEYAYKIPTEIVKFLS